MAVRRDVAPASPVATRLPRAPRLGAAHLPCLVRRGNTTRLVTNRYGSGARYVDALGNQTLTERNEHNQVTRDVFPNGASHEYLYDANNMLIDQIHSEGMRTRYTYDDLYRLVSLDSSVSPGLRLAYDESYNVTRLEIGGSLVIGFTHNAFGQPLTRTVNGETTEYDYDASGRLIRMTDPLGHATEYDYDTAGNRVLARDALGEETHFVYDMANRLNSMTDPNGGVIQFTYQSACATCGTGRHLLTSITDPAGNVTQFEYNELAQLVREIDPAGRITVYTYDGNRNLASRTDATGETITYEYDAIDRLIHKILPDDVEEYTYDVMGNMTSAHDGDSQIDYGYDAANRAISIATSGIAQPVLALTQDYQQSSFNRTLLYSTIDSAIHTRAFEWDGLLRMTGSGYGEDGDVLGTYRFGYDTKGRRDLMLHPDFEVLNYTYDAADRLLNITGTAFPGSLGYSYDAAGRRTTEQRVITTGPSASLVIDQAIVTDLTLLVNGQATGGITTVSVNGQPLTLDSASQIQGEVVLSPGFNDLTVSVTDDIGQTVIRSATVELQAAGTGVTIADIVDVAPNGDVYIIEDSGTAAVVPAGSESVDRPAWLEGVHDVAVDSNGRVYSLQGSQLWAHDASGDDLIADLSSLTVHDMEVGPDDQVYLATGSAFNFLIYRVDVQGNLVQHATILNGFSVTLDSSSWGLVAGTRARDNNFYRIGTDGTVETIYFTPYPFSTFAVDDTGRLCYSRLTVFQLTLEGFECRTPDGTITPLDISGTEGTRFEFDSANMLYYTTTDNVYRLEATGAVALIGIGGSLVQGSLTITADTHTDTGTASYSYDSHDQLTGVVRNGSVTESYAYDATGNRPSDHRAGDYVYNTLNQLISGNGIDYTYAAAGRRITRTDATGTTRYTYDAEHRLTRIDLPDGASAEYAYDPFGRRIQKRLVDNQGSETLRRYVYDGEDLLFELDGNDQLITEFIHGPGIDEPLALKRNGQLYTYHADALGSIIAITDENGALVQQYEYDAYGTITFTLDPAFEQPYGFTAREHDAESGLYFYRARYYDPNIGRFLTRDPIGFAGGDVNLYRYVFNDPINHVDSLGLWSISVGAGGSAHWLGIGGSITTSVAADSNGRVCMQFTKCGGIGAGFFGGLGFSGSYSQGNLCEGKSVSEGGYADLGAGPAFSGSVDRDTASGDISGAMGLVGVGAGAGGGVQSCSTTTMCFN